MPAPEPTVCERRPEASSNDRTLSEDIAWFASAFGKKANDVSGALSSGLREPFVGLRAETFKRDSRQRQAELTRRFGFRADAQARVAELLAAAGPTLAAEMVRLLPPWLKEGAPIAAPASAPAPLVRALAARLIREATRA